MKKILIIIAILAVIGAAAFWVFRKDGKKETPTETSSTAVNGIEVDGEFRIVVDACQLFVQTDADAVLGSGSTKSATTSGDTSSDDIRVSNCTYTLNTNPGELPVTDFIVTASLVTRSARTDIGAQSNATAFETLPEGAESVEGYGEGAFWNPQFGQLNILKENNWYILTNGPAAVGERTLEDAQKLADALMSKL